MGVLVRAAVYYGAARLGFAIAFVHGTVSAVWPPTGFALTLLGLAALVSTMVSATTATAALLLSRTIPMAGAWATWHVWWLGDVTGDVVVAPLLLVLATTAIGRPGGWRAAELAAFVLTLAMLAAVAHQLTLGIAYLARADRHSRHESDRCRGPPRRSRQARDHDRADTRAPASGADH